MRLTFTVFALSLALASTALAAKGPKAKAPAAKTKAPAANAPESAPAEGSPAVAPPPAPAADAPPALPSTARVMERLNDLFRADSSEARLSMKIVTDRYRRDLVLESWTRGRKEALIVVREPAREAGMATLRSEEGLWSYAPRADRLVRIPNTLLSDNWMGSHFTNDDLMRQTDFTRDYDASLEWKHEGGKRLLQATLKPKPEAPVVWSRIVYLLEPRDYLPLRADYYDNDKIARTLAFSDPREVSGRRVPFALEMTPADKPGESTRIEYREVKFDVNVDPSLFTQRGLRRGARL
jgi:hypothetical protein